MFKGSFAGFEQKGKGEPFKHFKPYGNEKYFANNN